MAEVTPQRQWSDQILKAVLVGIFLSLGFMAWSFYSLSVGLGFVRLEIPQLALGALYAATYASMVLLVSLAIAHLSVWATKKWRHQRAESKTLARLHVAFLVMTAITSVAALLDWTGLISTPAPYAFAFVVFGVLYLVCAALQRDLKEGQNFVWKIFYAVATILAVPLGIAALVRFQSEVPPAEIAANAVLFILPALAFVTMSPFEAPLPGVRKVFRANRAARSLRPHALSVNPAKLLVPMALTLIIASVTTGITLLPEIPPHLGGAAPRTANFLLDPQDFDNTTQHLLFDATFPGEGYEGTRKSVNLTVVFRNSDMFFIRIPPNDHATDQSLELPINRVLGIYWH